MPEDEEIASDYERKGVLPEPQMPWWKKTGPVAAIASVIAATVPITTAVWANIEKTKELELQRSKDSQEAKMEELKIRHSIQMDYLQHMDKDEDRERTLRMILAMHDDDPKLKAWATTEQQFVDQSIAEYRQDLDDERKALGAEEKRADDLAAEGPSKSGKLARLQDVECRARAAMCVTMYHEGLRPYGVAPSPTQVTLDRGTANRLCRKEGVQCIQTGVWADPFAKYLAGLPPRSAENVVEP